MSARARILAWVLLVVLLALAGSLLATRTVLHNQLDERLDNEIAHETNKLRAYLASPDSRPAGQAGTVETVLGRHLERNLPEKYETFFSIVDGAASRRSAIEPPVRLDTDNQLVAELARATTPTYGTVTTTVGSARYGVIPVTVEGAPGRGALVIVEFVDHAAGESNDVIGVMAAMSGAALVLAGLIGWLVAGRILAPVREVRLAAEQTLAKSRPLADRAWRPRDSVVDRVAGLSGGADDYLAKPFAFEELLARIRLRLRGNQEAEPAVLRAGDLTLDLRTRRGIRCRGGKRPHRPRVRVAGDVAAQPGTGAVEGTTARRCLGIRLRSRLQRGGRLYPVSCAVWDTGSVSPHETVLIRPSSPSRFGAAQWFS